MKCKQVEQILINQNVGKLDPEIRSAVDEHIAQCSTCSRFSEQLKVIRSAVKNIEAPQPSTCIVKRTSSLCYRELLGMDKLTEPVNLKPASVQTPAFIYILFFIIFGITLLWAASVFLDYYNHQTMTHQTIWVITIIVQNLFALLLAPVLLKAIKEKYLAVDFL